MASSMPIVPTCRCVVSSTLPRWGHQSEASSVPIVPDLKGDDSAIYPPGMTHGAPVCNPNLVPGAGARGLLLHPAGNTKVGILGADCTRPQGWCLPSWGDTLGTLVFNPNLVPGAGVRCLLLHPASDDEGELWLFVTAGYRPAQISDRGKVQGARIEYSPIRYKEISNIRFSRGENS